MMKKFLQIKADFWFFAMLGAVCYLGGEALNILLGVFVHEAGHLTAIFLLGAQAELILKGYGAKIIPIYPRKFAALKEIIVLLMGPATGIVVGLLLINYNKGFGEISLTFGVFNIMPIKGLDGGSIIRLLGVGSFWENIFGWGAIISLGYILAVFNPLKVENWTAIILVCFLVILQLEILKTDD